MKLHPRQLRAASLWAMAQTAERHQRWQTAYDLYRQVLAIYEDIGEQRAANDAIHQLYRIEQRRENWSEVAVYARALLARGVFFGRSQRAQSWLVLADAERRCQHFDSARHAFAESVRSHDSLLEARAFEIDAEGPVRATRSYTRARRRFDEASMYVGALDEWSRFETDMGNEQVAVAFRELAELIREQVNDWI